MNMHLFQKFKYFFPVQCHLRITQCKYKRFQQFAQRWLTAHVSAEQQQQCNEWLLGNNNNSAIMATSSSATTATNAWSLPKTKVIVQNDLKKTPYRPYQRYKVLSSGGTNNINSISSSAASMYNAAVSSLVNASVANLINVNASSTSTLATGLVSTTAPAGVVATGVNLNTLASVSAFNATNDGTATNITNLAPTPHCNSVAGLVQSSVVVVQEQPAQIRPMES